MNNCLCLYTLLSSSLPLDENLHLVLPFFLFLLPHWVQCFCCIISPGFRAVLVAPLCHVVGGLSPSITSLSRERRSSHETHIHLFSAAGSFGTHVEAIIRLAWESCNSNLTGRGISGLRVPCSLLSLTWWHSASGIHSATLYSAFCSTQNVLVQKRVVLKGRSVEFFNHSDRK